MFIKLDTPNGGSMLANLDHIATIERTFDKKSNTQRVICRDTENRAIGSLVRYGTPFDQIVDWLTSVIVPAAGHSVVQAFETEANSGVFESFITPIIAFRIHPDLSDYPQPITADAFDSDSAENWGILLPNGRVEVPYDGVCANVDAFIKKVTHESQPLVPPKST